MSVPDGGDLDSPGTLRRVLSQRASASGEIIFMLTDEHHLRLALNLLLGSSDTPAASAELSELAAATLALLVLVLIGSMSCDARCALVSGCHPPWPRSCAAAAGVWRQWGHGALR